MGSSGRLGVDRPNLTGQALAEMPKSPRSPPSSRTGAVRIIEVLAYPSVQLLDVTGPLQVFASANDMAADAGGTLPYSLRVVAKGGQGVTASAGLGLGFGGRERRDRFGAGAGGGGSRSNRGAGGGALSGGLSQASRRSGAV